MKGTLLLVLSLAAPAVAQVPHRAPVVAKPFAAMRVIPLLNGPNSIDLDGDGVLDQVFNARRENYNAHDFSLFTFYADYPGPYGDSVSWHLVPFFGGGDHEEYSQGTSEGADCMLRDIWVVQDTSVSRGPVEVIVGRREFGTSFASTEPVKFSLYQLVVNADGEFGFPRLSFRLRQTLLAPKRFCDVGNAAASLGLPVDVNPDAEGLDSTSTRS